MMTVNDRIHLFPAFLIALLLSIVALHFAAGPGECAQSPMLSVRSTVLVDAAQIDAASMLWPDAAPELRSKLENISIGFIQQPLGEITLPREQLAARLGPLSKQLLLPNQVRFRRRGEILNGKDILDRLRKLCLEQWADSPKEEIEINFRHVPSHLVLPGPLLEWRIEALSNQRSGMLLFALEAECTGGKVRKVIQVDVTRVIVAAQVDKLLKPGHIIGDDDVREHKIHLRTDHDRLPMALSEVIGRRVATVKSPGSLIRSQDLMPPTANSDCVTDSAVSSVVPSAVRSGVHALHQANRGILANHKTNGMGIQAAATYLINTGDKVDFEVNSNGLRLVVPARAVQAGNLGEEIKLINLQNQRPITGVITDHGKVTFHAP